MGIDWTDIKPNIAAQMATLSGLDPRFVRWVDEPSGTLAGALPVIWLRVNPVVSVGIEEEQRTDNGSDDQTVTMVGQRDFTLKIRIESFTPDISDDRHPANIGEALKIRLRRSSSVFARTGWCLRQLLMTKQIEYVESNRPVTAVLVDFLCGTVNVDVDDTQGAGDYIGEVIGSGTIKNQDGSTVDTPSFDVKS